MPNELLEFLRRALGLGEGDLDAGQMALRAVVVFIAALTIVRIGNKRFLGRNTAFDLVLAFILGSVLSRAITGNAPLFPTLVAGAVLVAMHWLLSVASYHSRALGVLFKGRSRELVRDGEIRWDGMRRSQITTHDLEEALRLEGKPADVEGVRAAYLERSGSISVIARSGEPRALEVSVEDGVKTVRIELPAGLPGSSRGA
ncbi:MAG: DUF421 domain-containing protein [Gemmatimonadota bacterium]